MKNISPAALIGIVLVLIICLISLCIACIYFLFVNIPGQISFGFPVRTTTPSPEVIRPPLSVEDTPVDPPQIPLVTPRVKDPQFVDPTAAILPYSDETRSTLEDTIVPLSDPYELAHRLGGGIPFLQTNEPPQPAYRIGRSESFWVGNMDTNIAFRITAILRYITDHAYFWIEDDLAYNEDDLIALAQAFETQIYPTTRAYFGSEWTPGIDGDPHLYILYTSGLGEDLAGYFSATDEYPPEIHEYSNGHEIFLFNADVIDLGDPYTYGVLAHEFQHMILWNRDRNEASWVNEGLSELAAFLNGYYESGFDRQYARNPDIQLNDWPDNRMGTGSHYGASFLFLNYILGRLGLDTLQPLVAQPEDGFSGIDAVLAENPVYDPLRDRPTTSEDLFLDWTIASYLNDEEFSDGRYSYPLFSDVNRPLVKETIHSCPSSDMTRDVAQFGVDYIRIACDGEFNLRFEGSIQVDLLPSDPHSGSYAFWSNKGDEADMTLTQQFDFSDLSAPISLAYWAWYDIEADYDYLYLLASRDGESWQILRTPSSTSEDPSGNSFGWAYNGVSGGHSTASWIQESVDISQFAGEKVYLRFEYVTDAAVYGEGFLLDDVAIPQAGYFSDFEINDGGWEAEGWVRVANVLPQVFQLALISVGENTSIEYLPLGEDAAYELPISIGDKVDELILVVTATTRHTRQRAAYRFSVIP